MRRPTHHAGQGEQCGLDLSHVPTFKQVIGLKYVIWLQAKGQDSFDEIPQIFQLEEKERWGLEIGRAHV